MNQQRRARITALISQLVDLENELNEVLSEEQDAYDNMPEGLQNSQRGEQMQNSISYLENAQGTLDTLCGELQDSIDMCI